MITTRLNIPGFSSTSLCISNCIVWTYPKRFVLTREDHKFTTGFSMGHILPVILKGAESKFGFEICQELDCTYVKVELQN